MVWVCVCVCVHACAVLNDAFASTHLNPSGAIPMHINNTRYPIALPNDRLPVAALQLHPPDVVQPEVRARVHPTLEAKRRGTEVLQSIGATGGTDNRVAELLVTLASHGEVRRPGFRGGGGGGGLGRRSWFLFSATGGGAVVEAAGRGTGASGYAVVVEGLASAGLLLLLLLRGGGGVVGVGGRRRRRGGGHYRVDVDVGGGGAGGAGGLVSHWVGPGWDGSGSGNGGKAGRRERG